MALTIKPLLAGTQKGPLRGQKIRTFVVTPDASKPTGGYTILASVFGLTTLDFAICADPQNAAAYYPGIRIGTAGTDCTLQFYNASATSTNAGTDIGTAISASVAALSTTPVPIMFIGR